LLETARKLPFIDRTVLHAANADALPASHPAREKLEASGGKAAAFVCVGERCSLPVDTPDKLAATVEGMRPVTIAA
jgi:uncharacterized protein YyaL (SSP411 family)